MALLRIPYFRQQQSHTCGPAVVRMILRYYHGSVSEEALSKQLHTTTRSGTRHQDLIRFFRRAGFTLTMREPARLAELTDFLAQQQPVIVHYREPSGNEGHYAIAIGINSKFLTLQDPWNGRHFKINLRSFLARWQTFEPGMRSRHWLLAVNIKKSQ